MVLEWHLLVDADSLKPKLRWPFLLCVQCFCSLHKHSTCQRQVFGFYLSVVRGCVWRVSAVFEDFTPSCVLSMCDFSLLLLVFCFAYISSKPEQVEWGGFYYLELSSELSNGFQVVGHSIHHHSSWAWVISMHLLEGRVQLEMLGEYGNISYLPSLFRN